MRFLDAALLVLAREEMPMTSVEIAGRAISAGLITTGGRTPEATMAAALYVEAKRSGSRVQKVAVPGHMRANRGSVKWTLSSTSDHDGPASGVASTGTVR